MLKAYTPILKWRLGEYQALYRLSPSIKDRVLPLLEIPPIEWDFEKSQLAKTIDQHLEPFAKRFATKWHRRPAFVDLGLLDSGYVMNDGRHPVTYVFDGIREREETAIPVTGLNRAGDYQEAVRNTLSLDRSGVCVRLSFEDLVHPDIDFRIKGLTDYFNLALSDVDFVIDLAAPEFEPLPAFASALHTAVEKIKSLAKGRSYAIAATSFPRTMGLLKRGSQTLDRSEWALYQQYRALLSAGKAEPRFGDYAIAYPVLPSEDMRFLRPAASLRYTIDDGWLIVKGQNVRDHGFGQYVEICRQVVHSPHFAGASFSLGDKYISECAAGHESTGQLTTWRWVGTNHHITKIVTDLASLP